MGALDPRDADRFGKLLGLLGSNHDGERAAAALKATEFLQARQLAWFDIGEMLKHPPAVVRPEPRWSAHKPASEHRHRANLLLLCGMAWNDWEKKFLRSIAGWTSTLSDKQRDTLASLESKAADFVARKGGGCDF